MSANPFGKVDGNSETDALVSAGVGGDGGIDSDNFTVEIYQRSATVAGIDGGIGLDEIFAVGNAQSASFRANDAGRDRAFQSERLTQGQYPIADLRGIAVAQFDGGQGSGAFDMKHGQIGCGIGFDIDGLKFAAVLQADHYLASAFHHVVICQDRA